MESNFTRHQKRKQQQAKVWITQFYKKQPAVKELAAFQSELTELVKNIKLRKVKNQQQNHLKEDIKKIYQSDKTLTSAHKSSNMYR